MRTAGLELQVTLVYLALLCSLGSGTCHPSTAVGDRGGGEKRLNNQVWVVFYEVSEMKYVRACCSPIRLAI